MNQPTYPFVDPRISLTAKLEVFESHDSVEFAGADPVLFGSRLLGEIAF